MCIIIDANKMGKFLKKSPESKPVHEWLDKRLGKIIYSVGEQFTEELTRNNAETQLDEYTKAGKAIRFNYEKVKTEQKKLEKENNLKSNDVHIIALARASKTRLLYTKDGDLIKDFKNRRFIDKGKIYSRQKNKNLLTGKICQR